MCIETNRINFYVHLSHKNPEELLLYNILQGVPKTQKLLKMIYCLHLNALALVKKLKVGYSRFCACAKGLL